MFCLAYRAVLLTPTENASRRVRELTGGVGVDLVLEVGGPATVTEAIRSVRFGGRIALISFLSGSALPLDAIEFIRSLAKLHAVRVGSRSMFRDLLRALDQHQLHPQIHRVFPFSRAPEAFQQLSKGSHFGKIAIGDGARKAIAYDIGDAADTLMRAMSVIRPRNAEDPAPHVIRRANLGLTQFR